MIGIYKITCVINKRIYVGKSTDIKTRRSKHWSLLRQGNHFNCYLQRSWNKYGENAFVFEVLEYCLEEILSIQEAYWVDSLKSTSRRGGFNLQVVNKGNHFRHSVVSKIKMSKAKLGSTVSKETKQKISKNLSEQFQKGTLKGYLSSAELRRKKVSQFSMQGLLIKKWNSATEACTALNLDIGNLTSTCKGKYKHCGGYRWGFGDNLPPLKQRKSRKYG